MTSLLIFFILYILYRELRNVREREEDLEREAAWRKEDVEFQRQQIDLLERINMTAWDHLHLERERS